MPQVSRALRSLVLRLLPASRREALLARSPNWRKAHPEGRTLVFDGYLGDLRVNIDTRFKVERIMWTGEYEPEFVRALPRLVPEGGTVIDIGANVGALTLALARRVGPAGRVLSFEPAPPNLARLRANLALNPALAGRVEVVACGLADEPGELGWTEEPGNPGNGMLGATGTTRVPVTTLDAHLDAHPLARVDLVKVDVEGLEEKVLRGAARTLETHRPVLYYESLGRFRSGREGAGGHDQVQRLLARLGYAFYRLDASGVPSPIGEGRHPPYTLASPRPLGPA